MVVTGPGGQPLRAPLDVTTDVAWLGFANGQLARTVGTALQEELRQRGLV